MGKVIITAALTGAVHVPSMSPYLPRTAEEIIEDAVLAHAAGAAVVHIHGRNSADGSPSSDVGLIRSIVEQIKKRCDAVIGITTGGRVGMTTDERLRAVSELKPEMASCNAGSMNFVLSPIAEKIKEPKYPWEIPFLQGTRDIVFSNTFSSMESYMRIMYGNGTCPEFEVYDAGMINNLAYFLDKGIARPPLYIQFVLGVLGGMAATPDNLLFLVRSARELLGDFVWSCAAAGRNQFALTTLAATIGGNVRVGLEDNLYLKPGALAKSSAEQVTLIREILDRLGLEAATPEEARKILSLKGLDHVEY
ncbi:MAG: 3-keto-5-aminohexanoate cleavage protein [Spirochaetes bacterium]|nr:3-keto-5-aminohexanoate cleavage protein [Spirochaetota bacterium]MBU1080448.1 3-keto-5-aminohexanoate cleavage protein [Spirochaetota bacterium]